MTLSPPRSIPAEPIDNIVDVIAAQAARHPQAPALLVGDTVWTYAGLIEATDALALTLRRNGFLPPKTEVANPRIGLACPDGWSYILLSLALLRAGACVAPIAGELTHRERHQLCADLALHGLVIERHFDWPQPPGTSQRLHWSGGEEAAATEPLQAQLHADLPPAPADFPESSLNALNPAFIRFSSGTTGASKGVVLSHATLLERVRAANQALNVGPEDRVIWILPMAHHFAVSMMLYLTHGATTVVVGSHLAQDVLDAAHQHQGTVLYGSPFHHALLVADPSGRSWPGLRLAVATASALPEATATAFLKRFGVPLTQAMGIIEVGLPLINTASARTHPTAIGRPTPSFEAQLRDEHGTLLEAHQIGELWLRGPGIFDAYLHPWEPRTEVLDAEGWFRTGDLALRNEQGDYQLMGRSQSVINVAGLKCFPEEVEAVLCEHPQVREARVYARSHPQVGFVPAAEIVPADPQNPPKSGVLTAHCRQRLSAYKRPLQFTFVSAIEKTASGKIKR